MRSTPLSTSSESEDGSKQRKRVIEDRIKYSGKGSEWIRSAVRGCIRSIMSRSRRRVDHLDQTRPSETPPNDR